MQILGNPDHCIESIKEIVAIVQPTPVRGPVHNYDPINYDEVYAEEYGGFGSSSGSNGRMAGGRGGGGERGARGGGDRRDLTRGSNSNNGRSIK